ncbi:hypothetical protein [Roseovarius marisflavi]|uniref:hypothetical protein n=1 Tax=Roseovarius marisflavi TaxID=1054996 RepID=UPI001C654A2D|nr:hypothetical protein [Roseovarius marisflavi]
MTVEVNDWLTNCVGPVNYVTEMWRKLARHTDVSKPETITRLGCASAFQFFENQQKQAILAKNRRYFRKQ